MREIVKKAESKRATRKIDEQIARSFGVSRHTIYKWKEKMGMTSGKTYQLSYHAIISYHIISFISVIITILTYHITSHHITNIISHHIIHIHIIIITYIIPISLSYHIESYRIVSYHITLYINHTIQYHTHHISYQMEFFWEMMSFLANLTSNC